MSNFVDNEVSRQVLSDLLREKSQQGLPGYFPMVPDAYKDYVSQIAEQNYPHLRARIPNFGDFLDAMSLNWLAKQRAFPLIAQGADFSEATDIPARLLNSSEIACLTLSASYVLLGKGAYLSENGASLIYKKIPLREVGVGDREVDSGFFVNGPIGIGKRLTITGPDTIRTSPLLSVYYHYDPANHFEGLRSSTEVTGPLSTNLAKTFNLLNDQTIKSC